MQIKGSAIAPIMARLPQIIIPNLPVHILHWGNYRQGNFETEEDILGITEDIAYALSRTDCYLHSYVIM